MDEVFTLTQYNSDSRTEDFIYSSQNIFDIIDKMYSVGFCNIEDFRIYITNFNGNSIPYKDWRSK